MTLLRVLLLTGLLLGLCAAPAGAWSDEDVSTALTQASNRHGVSRSLLRYIAYYETGGTFDPSVVGDSGNSWGLFQLHRRGLRPDFVALGYDDAFDPYQAADFTAYYIATYGQWGARMWSPVKRGLC